MKKNKTIVIAVVSILILASIFFVFYKKPVKEPEIITSHAFVGYENPKQIVDSADIVVEAEILDELSEKNSVLVESEGIIL